MICCFIYNQTEVAVAVEVKRVDKLHRSIEDSVEGKK